MNEQQQQQQQQQEEQPRCSSVVLDTILSYSNQSHDTFWKHVWQKACAVYRRPTTSNDTTTNNIDTTWTQQSAVLKWNGPPANPLETLVQHGAFILQELLHAARPKPLERGVDRPLDEQATAAERPLLFCNQAVLNASDRTAVYGDNLYSAFLDGCSVVLNHADVQVPWLAAVVDDLQLGAFPHAYANTYLTPPASQTAPPHADDRDVLVIQVVGQKQWTVYQHVPVMHPYPHEQVGKDGLAVPDQVLNGPVLLETTLHPGHVLYMPRGYVHQATATAREPSFHVTIALATHDWTLAGTLAQQLIPSVLYAQPDYRLALLPHHHHHHHHNNNNNNNNNNNDEELSEFVASLQTTLDQAWTRLRNQITAQAVHDHLQQRLSSHNGRAAKRRQAVYDKYTVAAKTAPSTAAVVGYHAARAVTWTSSIRAATAAERQACQQQQRRSSSSSNNNQQPMGLQVRENVADAVLQILAHVKQLQPQQSVRVCDLVAVCLAGSAVPPTLCPLTLLAFCKCSVELGALAVVHQQQQEEEIAKEEHSSRMKE